MLSARSTVTIGSQSLGASATTARATALPRATRTGMLSARSTVTIGSQSLGASATTARTTALPRATRTGMLSARSTVTIGSQSLDASATTARTTAFLPWRRHSLFGRVYESNPAPQALIVVLWVVSFTSDVSTWVTVGLGCAVRRTYVYRKTD